MLQPWGKGLLATTLRYPYEVRDAESYFDDIGEIHIPKDMLALAEHILDSKAADFDASKFHDRYEAAVVAIVNEKKAGLPVSVQRQIPRIVAGTDLMAALRQSIEAEAPRVAIKIRRLRCAGGAIVVGVVMSPSTPDSPRDPDDLRRLADDLRRDVAFVPLQCEFFALEGLSQLLTTVEQVRRTLNQALTIHRVVLTMYDLRNSLARQVVADVRAYMGDKVYETVIPRNVRLSEAPSHGRPALLYDLKCAGSQAYLNLASEVIQREGGWRAA